MKLYKVTAQSIRIPVLFIKAKSIEDCLFKARKKYENDGGVYSDELIERIISIEKLSDELIE